jgi:geranylgeranyl pyrophosphate synthase
MQIEQYYERYLNQIEMRMGELIHQNNPHPSVSEIISYHFKKPGKNLRSYLATSLSQSFNPMISDNELDFAASIELIHNASLIHDDLEDQDFYRRGELNVWKKFSPSQAINIGDLLFTKSLERVLLSTIPADVQLSLVRRMVSAINELIHGQMLEISFQNTTDMTRQNWEDIAAQKTGALLRLIFEGTLLLAGQNISDCQNELNSLGRTLGILYQTRDDLLDAMGLKEGRRQGSDILEGKMTCLSIKAFENSGREALVVTDALLNKNLSDDESRINGLIRLYEEQGIIFSLKNHYSDLLEQCREHPICLKFPQIKPVLSDFIDLLKIGSSELFVVRSVFASRTIKG